MLQTLKMLWKDEEGATMVEYGLIVAVIALVALVGAKLVGTDLDALFDKIVAEL